ncbi:MAG: ThiF family adenylyltransferase [Solirubrobacteraceae bacterium]|nr:ThiF family adenylyltransferase [Solirubrobacteraceae bacterium]
MSAAQTEPGDENGRYHRQSLISWWEQDRLAAARVLVVGAGALGNELVKNLALAGVGTVVVADMDTIENSNLSRCVFFRSSDEGRMKAEVVCEAAAGLNPDVEFIPVVGDIRHAIGLGSFTGFDLVLGGLDNREARLHTNQACWKAGIPWVDGAIEGLMGVVRVFTPPDSACYECTMSERDHELLAARRTCALLTREEMLDGKVPTTGTSASVVAGMQVQEAIKLLHQDRLPTSMAGKGFVVNGMTHDSYIVDYPRQDACMSHDTYALSQAEVVPRDETFRELLERGAAAHGLPLADVTIDLEHDVIVAFTCPVHGRGDDEPVLLTKATVGSALCPVCSAERALDVRHSVSSVDADLLNLSAADLGLPPADALTARSLSGRVHFMLDDPHPWQIVDAQLVEEEAR